MLRHPQLPHPGSSLPHQVEAVGKETNEDARVAEEREWRELGTEQMWEDGRAGDKDASQESWFGQQGP